MDHNRQIAATIGARPVVHAVGDRVIIREEIASLLKRTMGLDAAAIGLFSIDRAVHDRQLACNLADPDAYLDYVLVSQSELTELIEAVVVPETWFFRHHEALAEVARIACEEWWPTHTTGVLRMLSLPCSTGEEPYSIAMALLDAGLPASRFQIEAVDISERALTLARRAEYGKNSFRGNDLKFRDRHFTLTQCRWQLGDAARAQVHFQQGNLFSKDFLPGVEIFDMIFCRNLLIYFDRAAQDEVVSTLRRLLRAKGALFVGPSEPSLLLSHDFVSAKVPRAFAFHKPPTIPVNMVRKSVDPVKRPSNLHLRVPPRIPKPSSAVQDTRHKLQPSAKLEIRSETDIGKALLLANEGRLVEAEKSCEEHIRKHGASAPTLYLIGLIRDAGGDAAEATQYYRKALYLDHHHQEALSHLALVLRKQGDIVGARLLLDRMNRTERKSGK
jgi:chemotaxis protein methyltransferase WspC